VYGNFHDGRGLMLLAGFKSKVSKAAILANTALLLRHRMFELPLPLYPMHACGLVRNHLDGRYDHPRFPDDRVLQWLASYH
jgi:hypothetical protein